MVHVQLYSNAILHTWIDLHKHYIRVWCIDISICQYVVQELTLSNNVYSATPNLIKTKLSWHNTNTYVILDYQYMPANLCTTRVRPIKETAGVLTTPSTSLGSTMCSISSNFHLPDISEVIPALLPLKWKLNWCHTRDVVKSLHWLS